MENRAWYARLLDFNFGSPTGIDLPGEGSGILYPVERWTKFSRTSLPMGYEMALTPIQIAAALSAVVNGGTYYQPHIVAEIRDPEGNIVETIDPKPLRQVIRPTTSAIMRDLMEDVVVNGTGKKAQVPGYRIGGKTGTTRKSNVFDHREYIASFGGSFPINAPVATVYIYIDNPRTEYYASSVAAPAFQRIVRSTALHLGIAPNEDVLRLQDGFDATGELYLPVAEADVPERRVTLVGEMPDLAGMTMSQARSLIPRNVKTVQFLGSGFVSDQFPPAGDPLNETTEIVVHFSADEPTETELTQTAYNAGDRR
jgi:stage V sporulation protein D (sporulation-specific penicillin-binding protein)